MALQVVLRAAVAGIRVPHRVVQDDAVRVELRVLQLPEVDVLLLEVALVHQQALALLRRVRHLEAVLDAAVAPARQASSPPLPGATSAAALYPRRGRAPPAAPRQRAGPRRAP